MGNAQKEMKKMVKVDIRITLSKILAYVILIIGCTYSFIYKDSNILIATFSASSAVMAVKTFTERGRRKPDTTDTNEDGGLD